MLEFLRNLHWLLERLVKQRPELVSEKASRLLAEAWDELESEDRFERLEEAIASGRYDEALIEHGLRRRQLAMKTGIVDSGLEAVGAEENRFIAFFKKRRGIWKAALKAANVVLGSVADAIPGGAVVQEFKDGAEAALEQGVPRLQRIKGSFRRRSRIERVDVEEPPPPVVASE